MDWPTIVLLVLLSLGLVAGVTLAVRAWLTNPALIAGYCVALAQIAVRTAMRYLPYLIRYITKRMPPEQEAAWRECQRRNGKWNHAKRRCE